MPYPGFNGSVGQALRPYPQYLSITRPYQSEGHSTYHAFQLKSQKRFSQGLTFLVSYTASKVLTDTESQLGVPFSIAAQDNFNRKAEKSISQNDYPHNLVFSYSYDLPFGPGKKWASGGGVMGKVVGGWKLNGIQQYQSGTPMRVVANNPYSTFNIGRRVNVVSGVKKRTDVSPGDFDPARDRWINAAAFEIPAPFTLGNATHWFPDLRTPAYLNEDFSIIKRAPVNGRLNIEFRTDFINAFNRVVFGNYMPGNVFGGATNANLSDPATFGKLSSQTNGPRTIQFALKVHF